jgi:hypothetical protein
MTVEGSPKISTSWGLSWWLNDLLFHLVLRPISRQLYQETETLLGDLHWRQGYIAAYSASPSPTEPRRRLVLHTDDSEVTLNTNIDDVFEGGLLERRGLRGMADAGDLYGEYQPQIGRALIHAGRHLHEVSPIGSGDRFAYIMCVHHAGSILGWNTTTVSTVDQDGIEDDSLFHNKIKNRDRNNLTIH